MKEEGLLVEEEGRVFHGRVLEAKAEAEADDDVMWSGVEAKLIV